VVDERGRPTLTRGESGYDAHLSWNPSPGATAYRILWRRGWATDWEHELTVAAVTEATLPGVSIDDVVIGVAALDARGHESLVSAYVVSVRPPLKVLTK
jgi:hypothetical protein